MLMCKHTVIPYLPASTPAESNRDVMIGDYSLAHNARQPPVCRSPNPNRTIPYGIRNRTTFLGSNTPYSDTLTGRSWNPTCPET